MTTKQQEREALAKIKKIVEGLGEDSYVAIAFEGCFEIAEENIENDFACSMKQRYERADEEAVKAQQTHNEARQQVEALEAKVRELEAALEEERINVDAEHNFRLQEQSVRLDDRKNIEKLEAELHDRNMTILELKAKLYDFMTAGA